MGGGHWSRSAPTGTQAQSGLMLLTLLLLLVVLQTNSQEVPEWISLIREIKESMNKMNERFTENEHLHNISCPEHFTPINTTGECILIAKTYSTYKEATENCASIGAYLAVPKEVGSLGAFLFQRESSLSDDRFWIGAENNFSPHLWRWVDGKLVNALTLHYSTEAASMTYIDESGNLCGALCLGQHQYKTGYNSSGYTDNRLTWMKCDWQNRYPYLCEIEPGSETIGNELPFESICPEEYSKITTLEKGFNFEFNSTECVFISPIEKPCNYSKARSFCGSHGAELTQPWNITIFKSILTDLNFDRENGIWVHEQVIEGKEWRKLSRQQTYGYGDNQEDMDDDTDMCPLIRTSPPYNEFSREFASCSSIQNFMCYFYGMNDDLL